MCWLKGWRKPDLTSFPTSVCCCTDTELFDSDLMVAKRVVALLADMLVAAKCVAAKRVVGT